MANVLRFSCWLVPRAASPLVSVTPNPACTLKICQIFSHMVFAYFEGNKIWYLLTLKETIYDICLLWRKTKYDICLLWKKNDIWLLEENKNVKETKYGICLLWRKQNMIFAYFNGNQLLYLLTLKETSDGNCLLLGCWNYLLENQNHETACCTYVLAGYNQLTPTFCLKKKNYFFFKQIIRVLVCCLWLQPCENWDGNLEQHF